MALALLPALALAQSGGGQYEPTPPKPGGGGNPGGGGDPGTGGGTSASPGGAGSTASPATDGSASGDPATGGDATGSDGVQSGTDSGASAPPANESAAGHANGDRKRSGGAPKKLRLADASPLADVVDRPPAAIGAQAATGGGPGVVPLLIGILLVVTALAIILRGLLRGREAAG